jgi:hypothetical protein
MLGLIFNQVVSSPCERQYYQPYAREYQWQPAPNKAVGQLPPGPAEPEAGMGNHYLGLRHPNGGITRDQALGTQSDQQ